MDLEIILGAMMDTQTDLGKFLISWRKQHNLSLRGGADTIGVAPSTLSDLEKGRRKADIETLVAISDATGVALTEVAAKAGYMSKLSISAEERIGRLVSMVQAVPQLGPLFDALPSFSPEEVDTLLTVAETIIARRKK